MGSFLYSGQGVHYRRKKKLGITRKPSVFRIQFIEEKMIVFTP